MARTKNKLTAAMVRQSKPGLYADGDGLFLQVTKGRDGKSKRSWLVRVRLSGGKVREMGLGSAAHIALADARDKAEEARSLARDGVDPIVDRQLERARRVEQGARAMTFKQAAETYHSTHKASWRNAKHQHAWLKTLETYAYPVFGELPVQTIDITLVMQVLDPIWHTKTETATRVRGRIETVLDWAAVRGFRTGENPARWRGHLQRALPQRSRVQKVQHHKAMQYAALPAFMKQLRRNTSITARALEFTILTAARTGEVINAKWSEMDRIEGIWTVPAERMKGNREHRVPLGPRAHEIISQLDDLSGYSTDWVFAGAKEGRPLSSMAMLELLRGMKTGVTTHGFRSTFRDWAAEETIHAREVAEAALAHILGDASERAYQRGDFFEKRRLLMEDWDRYANGLGSRNKATKRPAHTRPAIKGSRKPPLSQKKSG